MSIVANIIRNATKSDKPLNIIIAPYDGIFEYSLCLNTPHTYYVMSACQKLAQPPVKHNRLIHLDNNPNTWNITLDFDLIICNEITTQVGLCQQISKVYHIPLLIIHHSLKQPFVKKEDIQIIRNSHANDTTVVMHEKINESWYSHFPVMPYYAPVEDNQHELKALIAGTFNPGQFNVLQAVKDNIKLPTTIVGNNTGISENKTFEECIELLKTHKVFINLFSELDLNQIMLRAMGLGCVVISSPSELVSAFITHGENGFIFKDVAELHKFVISDDIGKKAKMSIMKYNQPLENEEFSKQWNRLIDITSKKPFLG
jgi:glycosyltransferase involved in cell wall biosynthesis